jgi:cell division protein FtsW (lipid II flippase)
MRLATKMMTSAAALVLATATAAPATPYQPTGVLPTVTAVTMAPAAPTLHVVGAVLVQDAKLEVKVQDNSNRGAWYTQPMWIAIGVIAVVVIILLAVVAGRRDTTTVVK